MVVTGEAAGGDTAGAMMVVAVMVETMATAVVGCWAGRTVVLVGMAVASVVVVGLEGTWLRADGLIAHSGGVRWSARAGI